MTHGLGMPNYEALGDVHALNQLISSAVDKGQVEAEELEAKLGKHCRHIADFLMRCKYYESRSWFILSVRMDGLAQILWDRIEVESLQDSAFGLFFALIVPIIIPQMEGYERIRLTLVHEFSSTGTGLASLILAAMECHRGNETIQECGCAVLSCLSKATCGDVSFSTYKDADGGQCGEVIHCVIRAMATHSDSVIVQKSGISALHNQCSTSINAPTNLRVLMNIMTSSLGNLPSASPPTAERIGMDILRDSLKTIIGDIATGDTTMITMMCNVFCFLVRMRNVTTLLIEVIEIETNMIWTTCQRESVRDENLMASLHAVWGSIDAIRSR